MQNIKSLITNFVTTISEDPVEIFAKSIIRVAGFAAMTFVGACVIRAAVVVMYISWKFLTSPI